MRSSKYISSQKGFGLLEVLITIFVLGVVLIALARLQALLLQGGSYAKARSVALSLAQGKLEELRSFDQLATAGSGTFAYAEIKSSTEAESAVLITLPGDNVAYQRAWTVKFFYYCPEEADPENLILQEDENTEDGDNCGEPYNKPYPDFKVVTVKVTWTEPAYPEGTQVQLESTISANDPAKGIRALASPAPNETPQ